jgi:DNA-binding transcriptional LysR family regulator
MRMAAGHRRQGEDFATVLALVSAGLGIALLPRLVTSKLPKCIATVRITGAPINRRIYTARLRGREAAVATVFDDLLRA